MRILVTGAWKAALWELDTIRQMGHEVFWMQDEIGQMPCDYDAVEGVICNSLFLHHPLERFLSLKYIQLTSAGLDRVPVEEIRRRGIEFHNAQGVYSVPMAEFVLWGVLQIYKQGRFFMDNQLQNRWEKHRGLQELAGKTVCIVGCGSVGSECAKRFSAFDCRVLGVGRTNEQKAGFEKCFSIDCLSEALAESDIVVMALPLTERTRHIMNLSKFRAMKDGSIFVNVARGALVEEDALLWALKEKLNGAVLDVFPQEPLPEASALWQKENVIITPHNSFVGEQNGKRLYRLIIENLEKQESL